MRSTSDILTLLWLLATVAVACSHAVAADPPGKPEMRGGRGRADPIEILVEKEEPETEVVGRAAEDAAVAPNVQEVVERLRLRAGPDAMQREAVRCREIARRAEQFGQTFQPLLHLELARARQSCPGLSAEARRAVFAASQTALEPVAVMAATAMLAEPPKPYGHKVRRAIQEAVAGALRKHAHTDEFSRYAEESALRWERRKDAARMRIVFMLDDNLGLNAAQRDAVLADLSTRWQEAWMNILDENTNRTINGRRIAPDFAAACIEPHLTDRQKREWKAWCGAAGRHQFGEAWRFPDHDAELANPDPWWTP
jgi:hypothetical protein